MILFGLNKKIILNIFRKLLLKKFSNTNIEMEYDKSIERCSIMICNICGEKLRPIRNDNEKRFTHIKCDKEYMKEIIRTSKLKWELMKSCKGLAKYM